MTTCGHLDQIRVTVLPEPIEGCEECLKTGSRLAPPADVHDLRKDRLLRLLAEPARERARA